MMRIKYAELPQRSWRLRTRTASDDEAYVPRSRHHSIARAESSGGAKVSKVSFLPPTTYGFFLSGYVILSLFYIWRSRGKATSARKHAESD
jgi:hypothetical protein